MAVPGIQAAFCHNSGCAAWRESEQPSVSQEADGLFILGKRSASGFPLWFAAGSPADRRDQATPQARSSHADRRDQATPTGEIKPRRRRDEAKA
jgi:hypothetical protein